MRKQEFNDLIYYLKNRPEEANRLREVLGAAHDRLREETDARWLSAKEAGVLIGKTAHWVKDHIEIFPGAKKIARGSMYEYRIRAGEVKAAYETYIFRKEMEHEDCIPPMVRAQLESRLAI